MTIKRRLFISNILMIVIPVCISLIIAYVGISLQFMVSKHDKQGPFYNGYDDLVQLSAKLLEGKGEPKQEEIRQQIQAILKPADMSLVIYDSEKNLIRFNLHETPETEKLLQIVSAMDGQGFASLANKEVYTEQIQAEGRAYTVSIIGTATDDTDGQVTPAMATFLILVTLGIISAVFVTNQFLTRFVFKRIKQPLDTLVDGVHQIRDGNLDVRIEYGNKDEFASVCEDFNDMAIRLKESQRLIQRQEESRKELLAGISHDLRSPLTSVRAYSEGLLDGVASTPESQKKYITMIKNKAEDIDRMVGKIFLFSKMDLGDYPYEPEVLEVNQELFSLIKVTAEEYREKGLDVVIAALAAEVYIYADPAQFSSMVFNILENSWKYKDKERVQVTIRTKVMGTHMLICLEDNGPGVPEEALDKLFDVFYRSDPSRNNPTKGSGLGLAITAKAVSRMGGSIHAELSPAGGLRIIIKLPVTNKGA
ncbi:ATP-binding protein [Paenibacillus sp. FSL R7-0337]|uniref:sensor histidine kinase n=1 Tax=Paenibacillus sp. FSL R7-0337 TaxID=1926588 RepID=UPI00097015B5|nr:ATP-binding protein [Paenibacillus sp. FSL R7-0337]OMF98420.1 two-component sensor histidine kinase [Paenibacillus sp. FSL R7-0337]